ncbi:PulJ/GspJ family protein, partial [Paraburkholderia sp.]
MKTTVRSKRRGRMRARGFTLIELLVAIAIMAVIAVLSWRG